MCFLSDILAEDIRAYTDTEHIHGTRKSRNCMLPRLWPSAVFFKYHDARKFHLITSSMYDSISDCIPGHSSCWCEHPFRYLCIQWRVYSRNWSSSANRPSCPSSFCFFAEQSICSACHKQNAPILLHVVDCCPSHLVRGQGPVMSHISTELCMCFPFHTAITAVGIF